MQQTCAQCQASFAVTDADLAFLDKVSPVFAGKKEPIPPPSLCPECRLIRRLAFYNGRTLHRRTCDATGKPIISVYAQDKPYVVYANDVWYGDSWDPLSSGRPYDPSRSFFAQFGELMRAVPFPALALFNDNVNSDFTNDNYKTKNGYLVFDGEQGESVYYGHTYMQIRDCIDFLALTRSELCYSCIHCDGCYGLRFARFCHNCSDGWFLRDCIGCRDCFGCVNLRQKQYCIWNEQKTKEEYEAFLAAFDSGSAAAIQTMREQFEIFAVSHPVKALRGEQNVNCLGDNVHHSQNAWRCFDCDNHQDTRYCTDCIADMKDCMDIHIWGDKTELCYESALVGGTARSVIGGYYITLGCENVHYSLWCSRNSRNCFGCIGLQHKEHCILNTQYSKEEYEALVPQIVEHMRADGEWGEYFPETMSMFGYNETMAQSFFPLTKEQAISKGYQWCDSEPTVNAQKTVDAHSLPDHIDDIPDSSSVALAKEDDILEWAIVCEASGKPFKLIRQELEFYRAQRLPLPRRHPDQRHRDRFTLKNPYRLFERTCAKCHQPIVTSYAPDRPEIVYCESCYLASVY